MSYIKVDINRKLLPLMSIIKTIITSHPLSHLGRACHYPSWQKKDSLASCDTSCAIPTADESNHSAMGTLHQHGNATCIPYVTRL